VNAVADAPDSVAPIDAVAAAIQPPHLLRGATSTRAAAPDRHRCQPELQERELIKLAALSAAIADTLRKRGVKDPAASLAAEAGIAVFKSVRALDHRPGQRDFGTSSGVPWRAQGRDRRR